MNPAAVSDGEGSVANRVTFTGPLHVCAGAVIDATGLTLIGVVETTAGEISLKWMILPRGSLKKSSSFPLWVPGAAAKTV